MPITIKMKVEDVIVVDGDHGGFAAGHCSACGASGWIHRYGYPHRAKKVVRNHLQHKAKCPMNKVLNDDGSLKS